MVLLLARGKAMVNATGEGAPLYLKVSSLSFHGCCYGTPTVVVVVVVVAVLVAAAAAG